MTRTKIVPALVLLASLAVIAAIFGLQERAAAGRDAQIQLAALRTELMQLQNVPFQANPKTGGSPQRAGRQIRAGKARVAQILGQLRRESAVPALAAVDAPLRASYAPLDKIYAIGASGHDYDRT